MVDELSELIIPTDEHSPGARAAKVAGYIDFRLADAWDAQERTDWREGLKRIDAVVAGIGRQVVHAIVSRSSDSPC